ncbi:methyl-accepting chemotaxis protein [Siphonobacter sp. BAB-5405]|uniref:methyl-accepting chemotaxis protein n=1 Tax=Siphonobacter sp. BAB-5405 TaxID=1864825 RepID=UPI001E6445AD|nr:methyl-accepting chemotaxis protein [Siphonobacter sp. BAB-5405]
MKIKHKIILWFSSLVAGSLLLFSVYVYFTYSSLRQRAMDGWLERKARVTEQLITKDDAVVGKITTSLPEQVVFIYSPKDSLIFASEVTNDFLASQAFRKRVRDERLVRFSYQTPHHKYPKDGMALTYPGPWPSPSGQEYLVLVTAYDEDGYNRQSNLMDLLILGDIFAIVVVGLLGYFFSRQALKPLHRLIDQLPQEGSLGFRLQPENPNDEVGVLASAFNELLQRQEKLVDNQRAFISQLPTNYGRR